MVTGVAHGAKAAPSRLQSAPVPSVPYENWNVATDDAVCAAGPLATTAVPVGGGDTKLKFHFDGNYSQATQAFDQFATKNDSSLIFNGRVSLADIGTGNGRNLTLSLWGRNLFNEQYVFRRDPSNSLPAAPTSSVTSGSIANVLGDYGNFNAPRTYGVEASFKF